MVCRRWFVLMLLLPVSLLQAQDNNLLLWYRQPATRWTEALPVGNGSLGAMIYGGVQEEHIEFNESTLWTGRPRAYARKGASAYLQPIRSLLAAGKQQQAEQLAGEHFMGLKDVDDSVYAEDKAGWLQKVRKDESMGAAMLDDERWKTMQLPTLNGWETAGLSGVDGAVWFRSSFTLPAAWKGKKLMVSLGKIRDMDFTYVNGHLIASGEGISNKRVYTIPADAVHEGVNSIAVQVINFYDKGGFAGVKNNEKILVIYPEGASAGDGVSLTDWKYQVQDNNPPAYPQYQASYQPFGDVYFRFSHADSVTDYKRSLDISTAVSHVSYTAAGVHYERSYFVSAPKQVMVMHFSADKPGAVSLSAWFETEHVIHRIAQKDDHSITLLVQVKNGALRGLAYLTVVVRSGSVKTEGGKLVLNGADEATFYLTAATNYKNYLDVSGNPDAVCGARLLRLKGSSFDDILQEHISDYVSYFNTFSVALGKLNHPELPTDERIRRFSAETDPGLLALYMQYGRYLLISSSRPGGQPANLQGIWNDQITPPWGSKYTTNINLQMNYWPVDALNLSACADPLFNVIGELSVAGKQTALNHYGLPGWVLHHNTDLWRGTAPINASNHGIWVSGAAWLCHHIWDHYLYTKDVAFLRKYYPVMKAAATFFDGFLVKDSVTGWLISTPSNSPEQGGLVAGPTMDHQIIRDLYKNCIAAAGLLHMDKAAAAGWQKRYAQIAPDKIGRYGQLQEWMRDVDDTSNTHRHVSHLWGVYPGTDITWQQPELMRAARQSLIYRGDGGTGWSLAWKVNLWARFKEGDHAMVMLAKLLTPAENHGAEQGGVYSNLFDAHPPFQIDGNFGGTAGIAEMLVQSQGDSIELLPALPSVLPVGAVKGLKVRGGFVLNLDWEGGKLQLVKVTSLAGGKCRLKYGALEKELVTEKGKSYYVRF